MQPKQLNFTLSVSQDSSATYILKAGWQTWHKLCRQFVDTYKGERTLKIGQYLSKLGAHELWHRIIMLLSSSLLLSVVAHLTVLYVARRTMKHTLQRDRLNPSLTPTVIYQALQCFSLLLLVREHDNILSALTLQSSDGSIQTLPISTQYCTISMILILIYRRYSLPQRTQAY